MSWKILYSLDLFAILLFAASYYRNCYRCGYRIDFWHVQLFFVGVLPNLIMLPFARSELNAIVLGQDFSRVVAVLPQVFLIAMVGYFSMLIGGSLWWLRTGLGVRRTALRVLKVGPSCSMMLMSSPGLLVFQTLLCLSLQSIILALYFVKNGFGFDLRSYTFANPALRPIALIASNYSVIIASHCLARYVEKKERLLLGCTVLLGFGLVFFGARANLVVIFLNVFLCYLVQRGKQVNLLRIALLTVIIVLLGFYLGRVRDGDASLYDFFNLLAFLLLYGSNFSDLRDFAWVYSAWNHDLWFGKTYLAGLMSFIPRFASQFRDTWGAGVAMDLTVGLDPQTHPGLRPGTFGESFLNFGLLGVTVVGLLIGIITRRVDLDVKSAVSPPQPSMMRAFSSTMLLGVAACFAISASLSGLYVLCLIYLFSWLCLQVGSLIKWRPNSRAATSYTAT